MAQCPDKPSSIRQLQFLVTEDCNLNCVYCYENHKRPRRLSPEFIKDRVRLAMFADDSYEDLVVDFFGGEPLLEFETIRAVVEWFREQDWRGLKKRCTFGISTNGTLLDEERKDWFARNKEDVSLCLSMDGTPEAQNRNRSNSYDALAPHLGFFYECWPYQPVKMTISPQTVDQVFDGIMHLHSLGFGVDADVVFEDLWGDEKSLSESVALYAEQLDLLVHYYAVHPGIPRPRLVTRPIIQLFSSGWRRDLTLCGAGRDLICYTADGEQYPCMRFAPLTTCNPLKQLEESPDVENPRCTSCVFVSLCPSCKGHNYEINGSVWNRTTYACRFFQASLLASARLMLLDEPDLLTLSPPAENLPLRATKLFAIRAVNDWCNLDGYPAGAADVQDRHAPPRLCD